MVQLDRAAVNRSAPRSEALMAPPDGEGEGVSSTGRIWRTQNRKKRVGSRLESRVSAAYEGTIRHWSPVRESEIAKEQVTLRLRKLPVRPPPRENSGAVSGFFSVAPGKPSLTTTPNLPAPPAPPRAATTALEMAAPNGHPKTSIASSEQTPLLVLAPAPARGQQSQGRKYSVAVVCVLALTAGP
jgi:hypothetical protein